MCGRGQDETVEGGCGQNRKGLTTNDFKTDGNVRRLGAWGRGEFGSRGSFLHLMEMNVKLVWK